VSASLTGWPSLHSSVSRKGGPIEGPIAELALPTICLARTPQGTLFGSAYPHWSGVSEPERGGVGGQPTGLHLFPGCRRYDVPVFALSCEHSHRRRLLGSGASVARSRFPRVVISGGRHRHRWTLIRIGGGKEQFCRQCASGESFQTHPVSLHARSALRCWACPSVQS
jgi:hypothetical protein